MFHRKYVMLLNTCLLILIGLRGFGGDLFNYSANSTLREGTHNQWPHPLGGPPQVTKVPSGTWTLYPELIGIL